MKRRSQTTNARTARRLRRANETLEWRDVDATETNDTSRFAALSPSLLRDRIFQFLAPLPTVTNARSRRAGIELDHFKTQLAPLRAVCQQWYKLAQFLLAEGSKSVVTIVFETGSSTECRRMLKRAAQEGGAHVQQLTISMGDFLFSGQFYQMIDTQGHRSLSDLAWWTTVLGHFPNLQRLDLSRLAAASTSAVLTAAATSCHGISDLVLRSRRAKQGSRGSEDEDIGDSPRAVTDALRAWYNANGGLRFLTVPFWHRGGSDYASFIGDITAYCPNIEYLDRPGPKAKRVTLYRMYNWSKFWPNMPIDVWSAFCRGATQLRGMDWQLAPLSAEHVKVFTATHRPLLETLAFDLIGGMWDYDVVDLSPIMALVAHAPALRVFELLFKESAFFMSMAPNVSDELVCHVAHHCPLLEAFTYVNSQIAGNARTFTGESLVALAQHGRLRYLHVERVALRDDTLVTLLQGMQQRPTPKRYIDIVAVRNSAHAAIRTLLAHLVHESSAAERFAHSILELYVNEDHQQPAENGDSVATTQQSLGSRAEVKTMVETIKRKYAPWLTYIRVGVTTRTVGSETIETVTGLDLLMNVGDRRVRYAYADFDDDSRRIKSMRGGVFDALPHERSGSEPDSFDVWERTNRTTWQGSISSLLRTHIRQTAHLKLA